MAIIELDQGKDTPIITIPRGAFRLRMGYARSKDAFVTNRRGEDYLVAKVEGNRLAFALCDGVGLSFFGGWAAQILGEKLIDWLWREDTRQYFVSNPDIADAKSHLIDTLNAEVPNASQIISKKDYLSLSNAFIKNALKERLEKSGSQSNFVCGYIETDTSKFSKGVIWLFWLGDARIKVWKDLEEKTQLLGGKWLSEQSWSTKLGVVGELSAFRSSLEEITHIQSYTDGLIPFEQFIDHSVNSEYLNQIFYNQRITSGSDDISFFEATFPYDTNTNLEDLVPILRTSQASDLTPLVSSTLNAATDQQSFINQILIRKTKNRGEKQGWIIALALTFITGVLIGFLIRSLGSIPIFYTSTPTPTFIQNQYTVTPGPANTELQATTPFPALRSKTPTPYITSTQPTTDTINTTTPVTAVSITEAINSSPHPTPE